jgi:hypothetical protein
MKKMIVLVALALASIPAFAQFTFLTGLTASISDKKPDYVGVNNGVGATDYYSYSTQAFMINGLVYPKYHFAGATASSSSSKRTTIQRKTSTRTSSKRKVEPTKPFSLSVGMPLQIGASFGGIQTVFSYSAGLAADINVGNMRPNSENKLGGAFAGLGFAATNTNMLQLLSSTSLSSAPSGNVPIFPTVNDIKIRGLSVGPVVHGGAQVSTGRSTFGMRMAYQLGLNRLGKNYTSFTLIYTGGLGMGYGRGMW